MKCLNWLAWLTGDSIVVNIIPSEPGWGSFLLEGRLQFIKGHLAGEIFIKVLRNLWNILSSPFYPYRTEDCRSHS